MKARLLVLTGFGLVVAALGLASRRIAAHQAVLPEVTTRINTRVTRINQR